MVVPDLGSSNEGEAISSQEGTAPRTSQRVYIVDDDRMVRRALFFALREGGFSPRSFASGSDFLQEADSLEDGCVLLDLRMPDIDGLAVLESLGDRINHLPVVMISAHGEVTSAVAAMKHGAADFLEKPFTDTTLFEVLDHVFESLPADTGANDERSDALERIARLTPRESEVLQCLVAGLSNKQTAYRLNISARTVEVHRANLMNHLNATSLAEAIRLAILAGLQPIALERGVA